MKLKLPAPAQARAVQAPAAQAPAAQARAVQAPAAQAQAKTAPALVTKQRKSKSRPAKRLIKKVSGIVLTNKPKELVLRLILNACFGRRVSVKIVNVVSPPYLSRMKASYVVRTANVVSFTLTR